MALPVNKPKVLLADKGYDGNVVRVNLLMRAILPIIPPKAIRRAPIACDFRRNRVERRGRLPKTSTPNRHPLRKDRAIVR